LCYSFCSSTIFGSYRIPRREDLSTKAPSPNRNSNHPHRKTPCLPLEQNLRNKHVHYRHWNQRAALSLYYACALEQPTQLRIQREQPHRFQRCSPTVYAKCICKMYMQNVYALRCALFANLVTSQRAPKLILYTADSCLKQKG